MVDMHRSPPVKEDLKVGDTPPLRASDPTLIPASQTLSMQPKNRMGPLNAGQARPLESRGNEVGRARCGSQSLQVAFGNTEPRKGLGGGVDAGGLCGTLGEGWDETTVERGHCVVGAGEG